MASIDMHFDGEIPVAEAIGVVSEFLSDYGARPSSGSTFVADDRLPYFRVTDGYRKVTRAYTVNPHAGNRSTWSNRTTTHISIGVRKGANRISPDAKKQLYVRLERLVN